MDFRRTKGGMEDVRQRTGREEVYVIWSELFVLLVFKTR